MKNGKFSVGSTIILDTSVWIEHLRNNPDFFSKICTLLETGEILAIECVFGELLQVAKSKTENKIILQFWKHMPKLDFKDIIIEAGEYSAKYKLLDHGVGLIDVIILLHGIKSKSKIWTLDRKFLKTIPNNLKYKE